jgi:prophage regulatory protein
MASELYFTADDLERLTGTPKSTFRYWASVNQGPPSHRIGRRRVWRRDAVMKWLADQERATTTTTTA